MKYYDINQYQLSVTEMSILRDMIYSKDKHLTPFTSGDISKKYALQESETFDILSRLADMGLITKTSLSDDDVMINMTEEQYFNVLRILYTLNDITTSVCEMNIDEIERIVSAYRQIEEHLQHHDIQGYNLSMDDVSVLRVIVQLAIEGFNATMVDLREQLSSLGDVYYLELILNRLSQYNLITYDNDRNMHYLSSEQHKKATDIILDVRQMLNDNIL